MTYPFTQYVHMRLQLNPHRVDAHAIHRALKQELDGTPHLWALLGDNLICKPTPRKDWSAGMPQYLGRIPVIHASTHEYTPPPTGAQIRYGLIGNVTKGRKPLPDTGWGRWLHDKLGEALKLQSIQAEILKPAIGLKRTGKVIHHRVHFTGFISPGSPPSKTPPTSNTS